MAENSTLKAKAPEIKGLMNKVCIIPGRLDGKLAIVTGANSGVGAATTAELLRRGCRVIMACRNLEKANKAKEEILKKFGATNPDGLNVDVPDEIVRLSLKAVTEDQIIIEQLDLGTLQSIRDFAARIGSAYAKIDYLINNAGLAPDDFSKTADGFEQVVGVNHLGHFLLTELLLPNVKSAAPSRIIIVSSVGHKFGRVRKPNLYLEEKEFDPDKAYCDSKLLNVMHARELSRKLEGSGVTVVSLHPGAVDTDLPRSFKTLRRQFFALFIKPWVITPWQGTQTTLYTVLSENLVPGGYYSNCQLTSPSSIALNDEECKWVWEKSREIVGLDKD